MIGIVDSGGTKSQWAFIKDNEVKRSTTVGIHPYFQSAEQMKATIAHGLEGRGSLLKKLYVYGAGIGAPTFYQQLLTF